MSAENPAGIPASETDIVFVVAFAIMLIEVSVPVFCVGFALSGPAAPLFKPLVRRLAGRGAEKTTSKEEGDDGKDEARDTRK